LDVYLVFDAADEAGKALPVFCADLRDMDLFHGIAREGAIAGQRFLASERAKEVSPFDLKLLAWNFKRVGRLLQAIELLRLNVVQFPQSVDAHRELINTMRQAQSSLAETAREYSALADELLRRGQDPRLARWFHQWLEARARPRQIAKREAVACAGTYGDRRFVAEGGNLYVLRSDGANTVKYRLQKAAGRLFVIDDDFLHGVRFEFAISSETGAATLTVLAIDGSRSEIARR
jgi:hypothetical protein